MNREIKTAVTKFIPNNPVLSQVIVEEMKNVFGSKMIPEEMAKMIVRFGLNLSRDMDAEVDSKVFREKLGSYIYQTRPRFMKQIMGGKR